MDLESRVRLNLTVEDAGSGMWKDPNVGGRLMELIESEEFCKILTRSSDNLLLVDTLKCFFSHADLFTVCFNPMFEEIFYV